MARIWDGAGTIQDALSRVLRHDAQLTVAGRTDAGVHALAQVAHVDVPRQSLDTRSIAGDPARLVRRLARLLPDDVSIRGCSFAPEGFDARFSALRRHYVYRITTSHAGPLPTRAFPEMTSNIGSKTSVSSSMASILRHSG